MGRDRNTSGDEGFGIEERGSQQFISIGNMGTLKFRYPWGPGTPANTSHNHYTHISYMILYFTTSYYTTLQYTTSHHISWHHITSHHITHANGHTHPIVYMYVNISNIELRSYVWLIQEKRTIIIGHHLADIDPII